MKNDKFVPLYLLVFFITFLLGYFLSPIIYLISLGIIISAKKNNPQNRAINILLAFFLVIIIIYLFGLAFWNSWDPTSLPGY